MAVLTTKVSQDDYPNWIKNAHEVISTNLLNCSISKEHRRGYVEVNIDFVNDIIGINEWLFIMDMNERGIALGHKSI